MTDFVHLDTFEAFQIEIGDTVEYDGVRFTVENITDGDDMTLSFSGTIVDGLDEGEGYVTGWLDSADEVDLLGYM